MTEDCDEGNDSTRFGHFAEDRTLDITNIIGKEKKSPKGGDFG